MRKKYEGLKEIKMAKTKNKKVLGTPKPKLAELKKEVYQLAHVKTTKKLKALRSEFASLDFRRKASWQTALTTLKGDDTWVSLPKDQWPKGKGWGKYYNPCVKLKLALYGHPLAGLYWGNHCNNALTKCGFEPVPAWECLHFNREKQLFLSVYVDDFK